MNIAAEDARFFVCSAMDRLKRALDSEEWPDSQELVEALGWIERALEHSRAANPDHQEDPVEPEFAIENPDIAELVPPLMAKLRGAEFEWSVPEPDENDPAGRTHYRVAVADEVLADLVRSGALVSVARRLSAAAQPDADRLRYAHRGIARRLGLDVEVAGKLADAFERIASADPAFEPARKEHERWRTQKAIASEQLVRVKRYARDPAGKRGPESKLPKTDVLRQEAAILEHLIDDARALDAAKSEPAREGLVGEALAALGHADLTAGVKARIVRTVWQKRESTPKHSKTLADALLAALYDVDERELRRLNFRGSLASRKDETAS